MADWRNKAWRPRPPHRPSNTWRAGGLGGRGAGRNSNRPARVQEVGVVIPPTDSAKMGEAVLVANAKGDDADSVSNWERAVKPTPPSEIMGNPQKVISEPSSEFDTSSLGVEKKEGCNLGFC
ncbi:hypothetical protein GUJ93_ZPchr0006g45574 [Zizania palustris]|uniref:Uncharacterized protein n=1 Tax=Zizania palustris TaxID=103762 RepID=A0A8J5SDF7_ZIZPA|nr:hypothetical protein GUJ93_ZPchr0006g45574 [Zizania palustris]